MLGTNDSPFSPQEPKPEKILMLHTMVWMKFVLTPPKDVYWVQVGIMGRPVHFRNVIVHKPWCLIAGRIFMLIQS